MKEAVLALKELEAYRVAFLRQSIRSQNAARAFVRRYLGWKADAAEGQREKINQEAAEWVRKIEKEPGLVARLAEGKAVPKTLQKVAGAVPFVIQMHRARLPLDLSRKKIESDMKALVRRLPFWPWCETISGIGEGLLVAEVIGEFGNFEFYTNPAKIWKRFGLAPFEGHAGATWRKDYQRKAAGLHALSAEQWNEAGYSPRRRSIMWNLGASLLKAKDGYYGVYLERKAVEARRDGLSKMQIHRRAQRYMEKRFLLDLWKAWHAASATSRE
jgi:hypothetical protein